MKRIEFLKTFESMPYFSFSPMNTRGFSIVKEKKKKGVKILMTFVNKHMRFLEREIYIHTHKRNDK